MKKNLSYINPVFIRRFIAKKISYHNKIKHFKRDYNKFEQLGKEFGIKLNKADIQKYLDDNSQYTHFDSHYIYHPAWAARKVREISPNKHIDISSTLHFSSILSAFVPVDFFDYRPAILRLSNLTSKSADLTNLFFETDSIECISCMHTVEHIGLGRYGDPIDPIGDLKAITELKRVCMKNGNIIFVVPVGKPKILFNAHRIYDPYKICALFEDEFDLIEFSVVLDDNSFIEDASMDVAADQNYGCGCFWFKKNENY